MTLLNKISNIEIMKKPIRKKTKKTTVADILNSCSLGDCLTDGTRTWKVSEISEVIVASPLNFPEGESSFELWNCGVESVAIIPGLKKI